jgi:hypothetical protein
LKIDRSAIVRQQVVPFKMAAAPQKNALSSPPSQVLKNLRSHWTRMLATIGNIVVLNPPLE